MKEGLIVPETEVNPAPLTISPELLREDLTQFVGKDGDIEGLMDYFISFAAEQKRIASFDDLTGTLNRGAFMEKIEILYNQARDSVAQAHERSRLNFSICMVDLDNFKVINDTYSHAAGDAALKLAAKAIVSVMRTGDLVCRYGGEEFAIAVGGPSQDYSMERVIVAERIRRAVEGVKFDWEGREIALTASVGAAKYKPGQNVDDIIHEADIAMYAAKKAGKNRTEVFEQMRAEGGK